RLAAQDAHQVARHRQVVDPQRDAVVAAQGKGGGVHHLQVAGDDLVVVQFLEAHRVGVLLRVLVVHAVDLGGLQQQVGVDLDRAQGGGRVGGEERVAGAGGEDRDAALLQVAHGAAADVVLAHV